MQVYRELGSVQALIEATAKFQIPQPAWQCRVVQTSVERMAKCQLVQALRELGFVQALIEAIAKCQLPKPAWQCRVVQASVEGATKYQAP